MIAIKAITAIVLVLALAAGGFALYFSLDAGKTPVSANNVKYTSEKNTVNLSEKDRFLSLASYELKTVGKKLLPTFASDVYVTDDYSEIYCVGASEVLRAAAEEVRVSLSLNGDDREVLINKISHNGRTMGFGSYSETLETSGTYSREYQCELMMTDMPSVLKTDENELLILVSYGEHGVYKDAFSFNTETNETKNLFPEKEAFPYPENYFIVTDELIYASGESFFFFSCKNYDFSQAYRLNPDEAKDLFIIDYEGERTVAEKIHNNYAYIAGDGTVRCMRNSYSSITYTIADRESVTYTQNSFKVLSIDINSGEETEICEYALAFSSNFKRDRNTLASITEDGLLRIYDFEYNQKAEYQLEGVSSLTGFSYKANETLVLGGSPTSVETGRQKLIVRDLKSNKQVSVSGLNLFLLHEDSLSLTDDGNLISVNYEGTVSEYTFTLTPLGELFDEFADKEI